MQCRIFDVLCRLAHVDPETIAVAEDQTIEPLTEQYMIEYQRVLIDKIERNKGRT